MKYLLDTHVLLWWLDKDSPLSPAARQMIDDGNNEIIVSAATIWELAIKQGLGKIQAPDDLLEILQQNNITLLPISVRHAHAVRSLIPLHKDPFDRLLIMQAHLEDMILMTHDKSIEAYRGHMRLFMV